MRVFILAGEPSGDKLGGALMAGLQKLRPGIEFDGIGGPLMQAQGLRSRFPMDELSVMGIAEILPKYRSLKRRINETAQAVIETRPDVLITIDSPDFSFRVAKRVRAASDLRTVHYVAPTVWAWRPRRAAKIAGFIDHVLALFPFEPPFFEAEGIDFDFVGPGHPLPAADLIILPGSKSVRSDLQFLKDQGWYSAIQKHCRFGGKLLGICAGLQMLGQAIHDPLGIESAAGSSEGFGFLDIETTLAAEKQLRRVSGQLMLEDAVVSGYEIHAGTSTGPALNSPFASLDNRPDGVIAADGQIIGTYLHGLFDESASRAAVLRWAGSGHVEPMDYQQLRENAIDQLADELERALDLERIESYLAD